jgi:hypothetical protein
VKVGREICGTPDGRPDFGILKERLRTAQTITPTAIASSKARAANAHADTLLQIFTGVAAADQIAGLGSFHAGLIAKTEGKAQI